jgi:circadian clock protein KaiB
MTATHDATVVPPEDKHAVPGEIHYELTLFVGGASDLSARAVADARQLCDVHLDGRYRLTVVDVHESAADVLDGRVLVAPTLVKDLPLPVRRVIGDLSRTEQVLQALELPVAGRAPRAE